ncbi:MAG: tyrosine-protein phosphatase [Bacillales bacterium]|nr:tyrosine-protein phosphatase [Bacillales bacterium]
MKNNNLLIATLSVVMLLGLASCGNNNLDNTTSSNPPQPQDAFYIVTDLLEEKEIHTDEQKAYLEYDGEYLTIPKDLYPDGQRHISDPNAVSLEWEYDPLESDDVSLKNYSVIFGKEEDLSDGYEVVGTKNPSIDLINVYLGTNYFKVKANYSDDTVEESNTYSFTVNSKYPRNIKIDGMTNCRDMGGRELEDGGTIKQGLIYRTSGTNSWGNNNAVIPDNITAAGKEELLNHLGVKTEINVNSNGSNQVGVQNFVGAYMDYGGTSKHHFSRNMESVKKVFETLANEDNYPLFYHCRIGTDRTGLCAILINGLLGVDKNDIYQDYLFSNFGNIQTKRYLGPDAGQDDITEYIKDIDKMPGDSFKNKVYNTLLSVGVTKDQLDSVINILTDGPKVTGNDKGQLTGFNASLEGVNTTARTSTNRNNPSTYFVLDGAGKGVSYKFTASEDYNATIVSYLGNNNYTASKYIDDAVTVKVDGTVVKVPHNSYQYVGFGNCSNRMNYVPVILGSIDLTKGEHTVVIERKGDTVNLGGISVFKNNNVSKD